MAAIPSRLNTSPASRGAGEPAPQLKLVTFDTPVIDTTSVARRGLPTPAPDFKRLELTSELLAELQEASDRLEKAQGARFEPSRATRVSTPLQGDPMLSPSGQLLVTRIKGREVTRRVGGEEIVTAEQSGYALHRVTTSRDGGALSASLEDVGRICMQGGKAVVSYDERWMVFHHYVVGSDAAEMGYSGPDDPDFEDYLAFGASNLYLVDLLDGSTRAITDMNPAQYALFPHFRSDGWIYFVVRTLNGAEYFAASDAAVLLGESGD